MRKRYETGSSSKDLVERDSQDTHHFRTHTFKVVDGSTFEKSLSRSPHKAPATYTEGLANLVRIPKDGLFNDHRYSASSKPPVDSSLNDRETERETAQPVPLDATAGQDKERGEKAEEEELEEEAEPANHPEEEKSAPAYESLPGEITEEREAACTGDAPETTGGEHEDEI